jgi:uncharacterized low-complexity protein
MKKTLGVTISSALLIGLANTAAQANDNPFMLKELSSGYQLGNINAAPPIAKDKDGKCGSGKCGSGKCGVKK